MALAPSQEQRDAHAIIRQTLALYGLTSERLATWALESLIAGKPIEQILLELEEQPEYKAAFPEIEARRNRGLELGVQFEPIGPSEILAYRSQAKSLMRSFGLPENFYTSNQDFYDFIVGDVSMAELNDRLTMASQRVANAPFEVRAAFSEIFGPAGDQALYTLFVDIDRALPQLEEMVQTAESSGAAARLGFGLDPADAARMAAANISYEEAIKGFRTLDIQRGLFDETLYETEDFTVGSQGINAAFGLEGGAAEELTRRGESRRAETGGSAGGAAEERGATSLGVAGRR